MSNLSFQRAILKQKGSSLITELHRRPRRIPAINRPRFIDIPPGVMHQADVLYLPTDPHTKSKYLLVVVDVGSGKTWAKPMKRVSDTLSRLKSIYSDVKPPRMISVDAGSEFKGDTFKWLDSKGIAVKMAQTGRHSQQAIVERRNRAIGGALLKLQDARERITKKTNTEWEADLPKVMRWINRLAKRRNEIKRKQMEKEPNVPRAVGIAKNLLDEGTIVRVALDYPKDIHGKRLHGTFRMGDARWSEPHRIRKLILNRNQPPMYTIETMNGKELRAAYVRERLQVVGKEKLPKAERVLIKPPKHDKPKRVRLKTVGEMFVYNGWDVKVTADKRGIIEASYISKKWPPIKVERKRFLASAKRIKTLNKLRYNNTS